MDIRSKDINTSRALRIIALNRGISRIEIARQMDMDKSSVTSIVNRLLKQDIITEVRALQAGVRGGRCPIALDINADYGSVLGLEIQSSYYRLIALDLHGKVIFAEDRAVSVDSGKLVGTVVRISKRLQKKLARRGLPVLGLGVGLSGIVDYHQGIIHKSFPLDINTPLLFLEEISDKLDIPVFIENDANCIGWGELAFHRPRLLRDFVCVLLRHWDKQDASKSLSPIGVGLGVVINSKVHHGQEYSAGEFRSIKWRLGNQGQFSMRDEELGSIHEDPRQFRLFGRELAQHLAFMVNTLNLSHVTLSGAFAEFFDELRDLIQTEVRKNWAYDEPVSCKVLTAAQGDDVVAYGAAGMVLERIFEHPEIPTKVSEQIPKGLSILMDR